MAADATFAAIPARVTAVEGRTAALESRATATEGHVTDLRVRDAAHTEQIGGLHESIERLTSVMDKVFWAIVGIPFAVAATITAAVLLHLIQ